MQVLNNQMGPFIVWINYGCEGWKPESFENIEQALLSEKFSSEWILTKPVKFEVKEKK